MSRQFMDPKTGKPAILGAMSWMPPPEPPSKRAEMLKKRELKAAREAARRAAAHAAATQSQPAAQLTDAQLRALNGKKSVITGWQTKRQRKEGQQDNDLNSSAAGALGAGGSNRPGSPSSSRPLGAHLIGGYGPGFPESGPNLKASSPRRNGSGFFDPVAEAQSLGGLGVGLGTERGPKASEPPATGRTDIFHRPVPSAPPPPPKVPASKDMDIITGLPRSARPVSTSGRPPQQSAAPQRFNILGVPIPEGPPVRPSSAAASAGDGGQNRGGYLVFNGIDEHYRRMGLVMHYGGGGAGGSRREEDALSDSADVAKTHQNEIAQQLLHRSERDIDVLGNQRRFSESRDPRRRKPEDLGGKGIALSAEADGARMKSSAAGGGRSSSATHHHFQLPTYISAPPALEIAEEGDRAHLATSGGVAARLRSATSQSRQGRTTATAATESVSVGTTSTKEFEAVAKRIIEASRGWGIRPLRLALRSRDTGRHGGGGFLPLNDLKHAAIALGVELNKADCEALRAASMPPGITSVEPGTVFLPRLFETLRGNTFGSKRDAACRQAFARAAMSTGGSASAAAAAIPIDQLVAVFDPTGHARYLPHDKDSARQIHRAFRQQWGSVGTSITEDMFVAFWKDCSPSFNRDDAFVSTLAGCFPTR